MQRTPARGLTGDCPGALLALDQAEGIYHDLGDPGGKVMVLNEAGTVNRLSGDIGQAGTCHRQALDLARQITSSWDEAHALAGLGRCALAAGQPAQAIMNLRHAREIFQRIGAIETDGICAELEALASADPASRS